VEEPFNEETLSHMVASEAALGSRTHILIMNRRAIKETISPFFMNARGRPLTGGSNKILPCTGEILNCHLRVSRTPPRLHFCFNTRLPDEVLMTWYLGGRSSIWLNVVLSVMSRSTLQLCLHFGPTPLAFEPLSREKQQKQKWSRQR
jgi:hypothetical protein